MDSKTVTIPKLKIPGFLNKANTLPRHAIVARKTAVKMAAEIIPAQILRSELRDVPLQVQANLPNQENLKKAIRRERGKVMRKNPTHLLQLAELDQYKSTIAGDQLLLYDSHF